MSSEDNYFHLEVILCNLFVLSERSVLIYTTNGQSSRHLLFVCCEPHDVSHLPFSSDAYALLFARINSNVDSRVDKVIEHFRLFFVVNRFIEKNRILVCQVKTFTSTRLNGCDVFDDGCCWSVLPRFHPVVRMSLMSSIDSRASKSAPIDDWSR